MNPKSSFIKPLYALLAALFLTLTGCYESSCDEVHQNPVLRDNPKSSVAYQRELAKLAQEYKGETEFKFEEYADQDTATFMVLNVFGPDFCGELHLQVPAAEGRSAKGQDKIGFKNGEVKGLKFSIPDNGYPVLVNFSEFEN